MPVQYYFDNLDPTTFQRLINALLTARFGEAVRLLPLRGTDGGRDAETAPLPALFEIVVDKPPFFPADIRLKAGRYVFQVKYHRTTDHPGSGVRSTVLSDFETEIISNVLNRDPSEAVNYFFLITNVASSKESVARVDEKRKELLGGRTDIAADVLWQEHIISWLDQSPRVWNSFPELFPGMVVPVIGQIAASSSQALPRSIRIAVNEQSKRDEVIRFRQINLEQRLSRLFVDLDVYAPALSRTVVQAVYAAQAQDDVAPGQYYWSEEGGISCLGVLISELAGGPQRIILEGGPGQGKSTISQMLAQLYRSKLLNTEQEYKSVWANISKARFPFRLELRVFAEWLGTKDGSIEQFLAETFSRDAGGGNITVETLHTIVENQPVLLICDGLDEVGSDDLRDVVISKISECVVRFEVNLKADVRVVLTTRPPAIAGRMDKLTGFIRIQIIPLSNSKVTDFVKRWTEVQCGERYEREQVSNSFNKRKSEQHVQVLVKNPMQLSVLLHFIRLKGEAFPDRRAELYREYFKTVIDRDVEKSPQLRLYRDDIEALHEVIGFEIHSRAESDAAAASLRHEDLIEIVRKWLAGQGRKAELADDLFRLGKERLGLIMVLKGEGEDARYGFDVQPIREYFTAAYINDKCERDAHELFQLMVPRSFWHEVALFLAGLRRANEKADLLSRARTLDDNSENGWRGDGRSIVLQLLLEGVLTTPGHVHQEAISFLVEGLDPSARTLTRGSKGIIASLPDLIKSCDSHQPRESVRGLLYKALSGEDRHAIWRLWKVAHQVIPARDLQDPILEYSSTREGLEPLVKLVWPAQGGLDFADALEHERPLVELPCRAWAQCWFLAAFAQPSLTGLQATANYHELLVEQFAFQPLFREKHAERKNCLRPAKPYAIWRLCENIQLLALAVAFGRQDLSPSTKEIDFSGLSDFTRVYVGSLIENSAAAIDRLNRGLTISQSLGEFLEVLDNMLTADGLPAWVACRCVVALMQYAEGVRSSVTEDGLRYYLAPKTSRLYHVDGWRNLRRNLTPLFRAAIPHDLDRAGKTLAARILQNDLSRSCPSHVRISGKLESVPAILTRRWLDSSPQNDWLERAPFPNYWVPDLLKTDPTLKSLALLASRRLSSYGPSVSLDIKEMKALLSAVCTSSDPAFAAGALFASLGSKCWNLAKISTLGKMLESDAYFSDIGARLFSSHGRLDALPVRITQLAQAVVRNEFKTSLSTSVAAAQFLAERTTVKLPPLRSIGAFVGSKA